MSSVSRITAGELYSSQQIPRALLVCAAFNKAQPGIQLYCDIPTFKVGARINNVPTTPGSDPDAALTAARRLVDSAYASMHEDVPVQTEHFSKRVDDAASCKNTITAVRDWFDLQGAPPLEWNLELNCLEAMIDSKLIDFGSVRDGEVFVRTVDCVEVEPDYLVHLCNAANMGLGPAAVYPFKNEHGWWFASHVSEACDTTDITSLDAALRSCVSAVLHQRQRMMSFLPD